MNFSSKSILSPGHSDKSREPTLSFSSSLSRRRLRSNGSISSSSPMFPTGSKKRGCAFDTPEPSSPKVTCIGQVRVNTKKKKKKQQGIKNRNGDVMSFRKATTDHHQEEGIDCLPHRNPKWVHLPFTICEALRSFGADFNCFQPCGGRSCSSASTSQKEEKSTTTMPSGSTTAVAASSCGAIFLRWLMTLQEGERVEEKRRRMEIGEEEEEVEIDRIKLVDEMEIEEEEKREVEGARVSICIPPKNALLLMRCRSDPLRMSSLANRFWDSPVAKEVEDDEYYDQESDGDDDDAEEEVQERRNEQEELEMNQESEDDDEVVELEERDEEEEVPELEELERTQGNSEEDTLEENVQEQVNLLEGNNYLEEEEEVVVMVNGFSPEAIESPRFEEPELPKTVTDDAKEERLELDNGFSPESLNLEEPNIEERVMVDGGKDDDEEEPELPKTVTDDSNEERLELDNGFSPGSLNLDEPNLEERVMVDAAKDDDEELELEERVMVDAGKDDDEEPELEERLMVDAEKDNDEEVVNGSSSSSPETLEIPRLGENPKLQERKEVEEFIELAEEEPTLAEEVAVLYLDDRIEKSIVGEEEKDTVEIEEEIHEHGNEEGIVHQLPDCLLLMLYEPKLSMEVSKETWVCSTDFIRKKHRREVCKKRISFNSESNPTAEVVVAAAHPAPGPGPSMASLIEQKLVNAVAYEPLVLTRCKSEPPLRSFSAKLGF